MDFFKIQNYMLLIRETLQILGHRKVENTKMKDTSYKQEKRKADTATVFILKKIFWSKKQS